MAAFDWHAALVDVQYALEVVHRHHLGAVVIEQDHLLLVVAAEPRLRHVRHRVVFGVVFVHEVCLAHASATVKQEDLEVGAVLGGGAGGGAVPRCPCGT